MQAPHFPVFRPVLSPCTGVCSLDDAGQCIGCRRTSAEIAAWALMDDEARLRVMDSLAARQAGNTPA